MTINDIYNTMLFAVAKNKQQGYLSPSDFGVSFNIAQKAYAAYLLGNFQQYQPGRPVATVQWGGNQTVRQKLTPIIYVVNLNIDSTGFSAYPGDYMQEDAMWSQYGYQRIRYASQEQHWFFYQSIINPYPANPYHLIEDQGFRFFPQNYTAAKLSYVRQPPDVVWGYTLDGNGRPVYSAAASTQCLFDDDSILEIITRALRIVGVNLQFGQVVQYANEVKLQGQ